MYPTKIDFRSESDGVQTWLAWEGNRLMAHAFCNPGAAASDHVFAVRVLVDPRAPLPRQAGCGVDTTPELNARAQAAAQVRRARYEIEINGLASYQEKFAEQEA